MPCPFTSSDQSNTKAKLMKCQEYIQQAEERLQKDVDQLGEILLTMFSKDVVVKTICT